ncbi:exosortase-associated protein EpsI, V-type [Phenylobacterium sp.]|uniref:exosortase-associated protein EpsI, V-type n=1 Tax=Phenylobacterium sp. TaxID=1871053 RepID=UPI0025F1711C|nr:exosortase-associated protein EpsI, V-type [Phenylobacterium sp.]MBX3483733.1 EpsI family protein [Phenylobacterium sp.]MCW5758148.1 EpsI family protein [Phenylobacterium sp.]
MIKRRDLLLAGLAVGGLGTAEALRPRKRLTLLGKGATISGALPQTFSGWESEDTTLVNPAMAGRLAKTLYSETVSRLYYDQTGHEVMMLIAYGDTQSDLLQLHRPESCYPAVGYTIQLSKATDVVVSPSVSVPARRVIASTEDRVENIIYWTRLGERLPQSAGDQRTARLQNAMEGYVPDGVLIRLSTFGDVPDVAFNTLDSFIPLMLRAVQPKQLPAFIGTSLARRLA